MRTERFMCGHINDSSSATRPTAHPPKYAEYERGGRNDCKPRRHAGFAAASGLNEAATWAFTEVVDRGSLEPALRFHGKFLVHIFIEFPLDR
jgi:hypothetical protein